MNPTYSFWDISAANVVTWIVLLIGFIGSQYVTMRLLGSRMEQFDGWRRDHVIESRERDRIDRKLEISMEKLTLLAATAERRLEKLEADRDRDR
jgi:hypothetical protein